MTALLTVPYYFKRRAQMIVLFWCCLPHRWFVVGGNWQWKAKAKARYSSFQLYLVFVVLLLSVLSCQSCRRLPIYLFVEACERPNCECVVLVLLMKKAWEWEKRIFNFSVCTRDTYRKSNSIFFGQHEFRGRWASKRWKKVSRVVGGGRKEGCVASASHKYWRNFNLLTNCVLDGP